MSREMKYSGIEWIGEIPKKWRVKPLKWILRKPLQYGANESGITFDEALPRYVRITDILNNNLREDIQKQSLTEEQANGYILEDNDILFARSGGTVGKAFLFKSKYGRCAFAGYLIRAQINDNNDSCYIYYFTQSSAYEEWKRQIFIQATIQNIGADRYSLLEIPLPSLSDQQKIAEYLDKVCGEIDEMVALQEKMIEELKAYKQSVITEAVTKGLNPDVPMKNSGIDWVGDIPVHWKLIHFYKTNWIRARLGWKGLKAEEYVEMGYPFLSAFNIVNDKLEWNDLNFINKERYDESPEIKLSVGDLLLVKDGAGIGKCAVVDSLPLGEATVNSSLAVVSPNRNYIESKFQYYYFKSSIFQNTIWLLKIGMGVPHLTQENMKDIVIPCPPLSEQQSIASYLDTMCSEIDSLITIKLQKIEELKEYKKSIIYEYVTGKKEVV